MKSKMRVAIFSDVYLPTVSGLSTSVQDISRLLAERGHQVLVVAPKPNGNSSLDQFNIHKNIELFWAPAVDLRLYPDIRIGFPNMEMLRKLKAFKPDIIHTQAPFSVGFQGLVLGKRQKIPLISTHHTNFTDEESLKVLNLYGSSIAIQLQKGAGKVISFFLNKHNNLIVPTQDTYDDLRRMNVELPTTIIPSPVDSDRIVKAKKKGKQLRDKLKLDKTCLYVGRLSGEKNIDLVIRSFQIARQSIPELRLVLIGDGPDRSRLFELASDLRVNESIIWTGQIDHDELIDQGYLFLGDVFVTLSRFETQGISTIEAMACGMPVVGANARATRELIKDVGVAVGTDNLDLVAEELVKLFKDRRSYNRLSKQSIKKAAEFSPKTITNKIEQAYQELIN